jgi:hypothetical protein
MIHPIGLRCDPDGWAVVDDLDPTRPIPQGVWGDVNILARRFTAARAATRAGPRSLGI